MNQVFAVPAFPLAQRLAAALATISVAVLWAPALPASPLLALAGELSSHCACCHTARTWPWQPGKLCQHCSRHGAAAAPCVHLRNLALRHSCLARCCGGCSSRCWIAQERSSKPYSSKPSAANGIICFRSLTFCHTGLTLQCVVVQALWWLIQFSQRGKQKQLACSAWQIRWRRCGGA